MDLFKKLKKEFTDIIRRSKNSSPDLKNHIAPSGTIDNLPPGLTLKKIKTAFLDLLNARQTKDLSVVRRWISDGLYQTLAVRFTMMHRLSQSNKITNVNIQDIRVVNVKNDGLYQVADIAINFILNDQFICETNPSFSESYVGVSMTEYWTFIKRIYEAQTKDLYSSQNCPECGVSLENKVVEVSRCANCNTLTNNAVYDWVLVKITREEEYRPGNKLYNDLKLKELTKHDQFFSIQRIEDIASNIFMQVMQATAGGNDKKLNRFADKAVAERIVQRKSATASFVFDRLFLNDVTLMGYNTKKDKLNLIFSLDASYRRVQTTQTFTYIDQEMNSYNFRMTLLKDLASFEKEQKEISFGNECPTCSAPYTDATNDNCLHCDSSVMDSSVNWILTDF